jgi:etoposide-induced 2.4 mRNA
MSAAEYAALAFKAFCDGVQHAISLHRILLFYLQSRLICVSSAKCFVLNGLIFLGSIFFFDQVVIPVIHLFGEILQHSFAAACVCFPSLRPLTLLTQSSPDSPSQAEDVRDRVDGFVFLLYQVLWMYPIYCISFILNTIWYQEIADDGE